MHYSALVLALVGLGAAQTATSSAVTSAITGGTSGCGTQIDIIIASCLGTENAMLSACTPNDWNCLCAQSTNVATCYNNCPADPQAFGAQQTQISYCNAAKVYGSSSSSLASSTTSTPTSSQTNTASPTTGGTSGSGSSGGSSTASASGAAASPSKSSGADAALQISGFAVLLGLAALF